jgi:hypothetical protein
MNKFEEYQIEIDDKNKNLILNYLESVREYIDKNSLDEDLYFDIEERVFEKLSSQEKINQLNIKKLLNEI